MKEEHKTWAIRIALLVYGFAAFGSISGIFPEPVIEKIGPIILAIFLIALFAGIYLLKSYIHGMFSPYHSLYNPFSDDDDEDYDDRTDSTIAPG